MSSGQVPLESVTAPDTAHDFTAPSSNVDASRPKTPPRDGPNLQLPANTPHNRKQSGTMPFSSSHINITADARNAALADETVGHIVGPMPVEKFLELYVPEAPNDIPFVQDKADEMQSRFREIIKKGESGMYQEWVYVPFCTFH